MQIPVSATDFMFDSRRLSDFGMMLCSFGGSTMEELSIGNKLTFNTIKPPLRDRRFFANAVYEDTITATLHICRKACGQTADNPLSTQEIDALLSWLIRRDGYHRFKLYQQGYEDIFFQAYFNDVQAVRIGGAVYGLTLTLTTDSPYAYGETVSLDLDMNKGVNYPVVNLSSEIRSLAPHHLTIQCLEAGNLRLTNRSDNKITGIANCSSQELITMDAVHKLITTSNPAHKLSNDFNYNYFQLVRTYDSNINVITSNLRCSLHLEYNPIRKVGIL